MPFLFPDDAMPYEIKQSAKGYCVHKQGDDEPVPGGCHKSKSKALRHLRALYANESAATVKEHTGVMIALPLPERYHPLVSELQALLPRGSALVPLEEIHLTLLYLGDSAELKNLKTRVYAGALNAIEWLEGIPATLTGVARFNGDEEGKNPLVLLVDSPRLPDIRHRVLQEVIQRNVPDDQHHGFIPHITLGYIPIDSKTPQMSVPQEQIIFDSFVVAWGDEHLIVPLSGMTIKAEGRGYGAKVGETISGNLVRGAGGKFSSSGSAQPAESEEEKPRGRRQKLGTTAAREAAAKLEARENKKRATASASEAKRQARRQETERRRAAAKRQRELVKQEGENRKRQLLAKNRKAVIDATQLDDASLSALEQFAKGSNLEPGEATDMLVAMGLVTKSPTTGEYVMTGPGKSLLSAVNSGDIRQAKDAENAGREARARERNKRIKKDESNKEASLSVFKDSSGRYRWVLLSSNAYRDRDGEIVSTKALLDDVARADKDKDYGPLRWWHVPGLDIGDCDFNAMSGRFLVESGTFRDERIGKAVLKAQDKFQASIGFRHPSTEPDVQGVYHNIRRFERSLTPLGRASNPFTRLVVQERQMEDMEKVQQLKATIGDEAFNALLSLIQSKQKENDAIGVAHKEASPDESPAPELTAADVARAVTTGTATTDSGAGTITFQPDTVSASGAFSIPENSLTEEPIYAGDLLPNELVSLITSNVVSALTPLVATKMKELSDEIKATLNTTTKADEIALLQEQQSRQAAQLEATIKALAVEHDKTTQALKAAQAQLAELAGEQPRALKQEQAPGYRASQAADTIIGETHRLKEAQPQGIDPNFWNAVIPGLGGGDANGGPPKY